MSHNARSHNIVLKITVPKRTGRKRRRGTNHAWQGDVEVGDAHAASSSNDVRSIARLDEPKVLRRKLADNADRYQAEAVGVIRHTHRFRGLADFYWDMSKSSLSQRYADQVLPGDGKAFSPSALCSVMALRSRLCPVRMPSQSVY